MERRAPLPVDVETVDTSSTLEEILYVWCSSPGRKVTFTFDSMFTMLEVGVVLQDVDDPFYVVNLGTIIGQFLR